VRIDKVEAMLLDRFLFVEITADNGLKGLGESGAWGFHESAAAAIDKFAEYLVGQDPLRIEHHWQYMYRWAHFRGSVVMGALSAIDIALWDLAGKHYKAPIHALFGGKLRDKARCYPPVFGRTKEELFAGVEQAKQRGFTAVGHLTPFFDSPQGGPYYEAHVRKIGDAVETVRQCREIAGPDIDLCIEIHRRLTPYEAVQLGRAIEPSRPLFIEDPVTPHNFDEMSYVASKVAVPIATGERMTSLWEFQMLVRRNCVQLIRPDVCMVGGLSGARKIAALAEASHIGVVPHNPLSAVSTAACLQIAATSTTFVIQELPPEWATTATTDRSSPDDLLVQGAPLVDSAGFLVIDDGPGLGVTLHANAAKLFPYRPHKVQTRLHVDGSVVDQ
jgi:galactonate dehydratase